MEFKLIKSLSTGRYLIELLEVNDKFIIKYENNSYHGVNYSENIADYKMASYLFDLKAEELEGN